MKETFGQRLQRLRKNAGLTQEEVAAKLNITGQAESQCEIDISAPDITVLVELSNILNVSLDELLDKPRETTIIPQEQRKDIDKMFFRVKVLSKDGDKVNLNIPLALAKGFLGSGEVSFAQVNGHDALSKIDFKQLFILVEQGVVGKLIEIESDGNIVEVWVE